MAPAACIVGSAYPPSLATPAVAAGLRGTAPGDTPDAYLGLLSTGGRGSPCKAARCCWLRGGARWSGIADPSPPAPFVPSPAEDELKLFGWITNTRVKLVVAVDDPAVKDEEMRAVRICCQLPFFYGPSGCWQQPPARKAPPPACTCSGARARTAPLHACSVRGMQRGHAPATDLAPLLPHCRSSGACTPRLWMLRPILSTPRAPPWPAPGLMPRYAPSPHPWGPAEPRASGLNSQALHLTSPADLT